jgi:ATP-dependent 26S proteasome regulatory subunit
MLANELNGAYCNNLMPWNAGESIPVLYSDTDPTEKCPLVIAFDEVDGALQEIHKGIPPHKNQKIHVQNKQGWNQMLDEIQMGFYPNIVIIMTTNKRPEFIDQLDPSYIRDHRVDRIYEMV